MECIDDLSSSNEPDGTTHFDIVAITFGSNVPLLYFQSLNSELVSEDQLYVGEGWPRPTETPDCELHEVGEWEAVALTDKLLNSWKSESGGNLQWQRLEDGRVELYGDGTQASNDSTGWGGSNFYNRDLLAGASLPFLVCPSSPSPQRVPISAEEIELLRRWVADGASWGEHWAFVPPRRLPLPEVVDAAWCRNAIDYFVLARLEREKLTPNGQAERPALIRRVTLDLTGVLPTPAEVADFVVDKSSDAYEKVVDRLLESRRYGEHRARYWMDYARYGDTQGLHVDNYQSRWPYRDYVIRAFNDDMPYDQLTREQLAGDLLPPERVDQLVATGLIRCGIATGEGGTIIEELKCNLKRERAEMFGAVYLGMTTGCAVCHDHKYDPLSQKDFYALTAFFNNLTEKASCDDRADWPPNIFVPKAANRDAYDAVLAKKASVLRHLEQRRAEADELIDAWVKQGNRPQAVSSDGLQLHLRLDMITNQAAPKRRCCTTVRPMPSQRRSPPPAPNRIGAKIPASGRDFGWRRTRE